MIHKLKIKSEYFDLVAARKKTFAIRCNNRNFQTGDTLELHEIDDSGSCTGAVCYALVTYILDNEYYLPKDYVAMSIDLWKVVKPSGTVIYTSGF